MNKESYNPDVLSCLANLSNDEVFTPPEVANKMLDMLPKELWSDKSVTFLDPFTKSGVFLREIAKRLIVGLETDFPVLQERLDHIFHNQLFGIGITELTSLLSRRSLYCSKYPNCKFSVSRFDNTEGNIRYKRIDHMWKDGKCVYCGASKKAFANREGLETHAYEFIHTLHPERIFDMKFDVIIGNPPYQLNDGGGTGSSAMPIYQKFIEQAKKLNPKYISMIIPSRWFTGGKGLDDFRATMIKDRKIKELHDFVNASECFPNVSIEGGVCYFLRDQNYNGKCRVFIHQQNGNIEESLRYLDEEKFDIFIRDSKVLDIVKHVISHKNKSFSEIVFPRNPFGLGNSAKFSNERLSGMYEALGRFNGKRAIKYIEHNKITKNVSLAKKFKLFVSKADGAAGQIGNPIPARIIGKAELGAEDSVCTETFLAVGPFDSRSEMENAKKYMETKFFRFLVGSRKNKNMTQETYNFVPLLDFRRSYDDKTLYEMFSLNKNQVDYIESMITEFDENFYSDLEAEDSDE